MASFRNRLASRYKVLSDDQQQNGDQSGDEKPVVEDKPMASKPGETDTRPGSSHPENWQTSLQSGKSQEEIRQDAVALAGILQSWQSQILQAQDYYNELTANSDKYLHMYNPILIKGLSREKLEAIATICKKFARLATIV
jgi:hypothetical protein